MKYEPTYEAETFYTINPDDPRSSGPAADPEESPGGWRSFLRNIFNRLRQGPVGRKRDDDETLWSSLFLDRATDGLLLPFRFLLKLISLTLLPGLWMILSWLFVTFILRTRIPASCYTATVVFLWMLRDSIVCLPARPRAQEFVRLFCHEAALKWLAWCPGFIACIYAVHRFQWREDEARTLGVAVGILSYFSLIDYVAWRFGNSNLRRYLLQVFRIVIFTVASTAGGFFGALFFQRPFWLCEVAASFTGFVGLWMAVNLFYWPFDWQWPRFTRERGEPLVEE